ncbi:MAG TPA: Ig-like domain-containing protein, partial [Anaerolineales bacterium]
GSGSLSGGVATLSTNALAVGPHANLTAVYAGNSSFAGSTSSAASLTVNKASSASALAAAPNPVVFGQSVTLTATVSVLAPGAGTPTGSVSFFDGSSLLGSGSLSGGVATFSTNALPVGSRNLTAQYNGDSSFTGSISPPKVLTIQGRQLFIPLITK